MPPLRAVLWCAVSTKPQTDEDKFSLPSQEKDERALCDREGWSPVAVLIVPGHSRRYVDIHELAEHARAEGIDAFDRILDLWRRRAFDVLVCRDGDRFARTQSLHAYFVERTIDIGARIYSLADGWIDEHNYRMWTSMSGYKAASHVDGLVAARQRGMEKRMERGLSGGLMLPDLYRTVRDDKGKAIRLEFREQYRSMMDDAADLLLEGVGWKQFAMQMYLRYGHVNPKTGQPYHDNSFRRWFYNPLVWGASAKGHADYKGTWAFDESEPLPDGVKVNRHPNPPIPAVWTGELAEQIKAELRRRADVVKGRAVSRTKYAFTGLLVCAVCARRFAVDASKGKRYLYWRCTAHTYRHQIQAQVCTNRLLLRDDVAQQQINDFLVRVLAQREFDIHKLVSNNQDTAQFRRQVTQVRTEITAAKREIDTMILKQAQAPANIEDRYARLIEQASQRLAGLESKLKRLESSLESEPVRRARQLAYEQLSRIGLPAFWQSSPHEINQLLHALMGRYHFIVENGAIIDVR